MQEVFVWTLDSVIGVILFCAIAAGAILGLAFIALQSVIDAIMNTVKKWRSK